MHALSTFRIALGAILMGIVGLGLLGYWATHETPDDGSGTAMAVFAGLSTLGSAFYTWHLVRRLMPKTKPAASGTGLDDVLGMGTREPLQKLAEAVREITDGSTCTVTVTIDPQPLASGRVVYRFVVGSDPPRSLTAKTSERLRQTVDALGQKLGAKELRSVVSVKIEAGVVQTVSMRHERAG